MRKATAERRLVLPDPVYNSEQVTRLINIIMHDGKKGVAQRAVYGAFVKVGEKTKRPPLEVYQQAVDNVMPSLELKVRRVGGANYQVPVEVRPERRSALALRWIITYARARSEKTMLDKLAGEIVDAANNQGASVKRKDDTHKMAEANRAFAHMKY